MLPFIHSKNQTPNLALFPSNLLPHLGVDGSNDGCAQVHAHGEATHKVLVQEERLQHCSHEHEHSIEVAMPVWLGLVLGELDHQPGHDTGMHCIRVVATL